MKSWNKTDRAGRNREHRDGWGRTGNRMRNASVRNTFAAVVISMLAALMTAGCGIGMDVEEDAAHAGAAEAGAKKPVEDENGLAQAEPAEIGGTGIGTMEADESAGPGTGETSGTAGGSTDYKVEEASGIANESARDAEVDFTILKKENPEIFGWLYIPDTSIDAPVLQSAESDDYYETHNAAKEPDAGGALYIEAANLSSMCDFNTVVHGKAGEAAEDGGSGIFTDLYRFADPDYFDSHEQMYLYLEDNVLTYEIFAAYERENTSLIRTYDFTWISGCEQFLKDMYNTRSMNMMIRSGWEDVTPYHFLVTLTACRGDNPEKQFVVLAALIEDPAGTIDRAVPAE